MKIAIFTDTFHPDINGVSRTLNELTNYLDRQNIEYKVFSPESPSTEYISEHIHRFKSYRFFLYPECRVAIPNFSNIKTELEAFSPDIIHVATPFNMGLCGIYFAKKRKIPLVGSYHTDFDYYLKFYNLPFLSKFVWKYMKWFHKSFKQLFVPSYETLKQLTNKGFTNLEIWPGGVDCELYHPYYDKNVVRERYGLTKKYLLTYVGRLAPEKDIATLLATAKALPCDVNDLVEWLIVGDGPSKKMMQEEALPNMRFTGYLEGRELASAYSASDLFVFPSPTETFGNVVMEALASGTPAIVANSGGIKNIVQHGVTGLMCNPGQVEEFADTITSLIRNNVERKRIGFEARNYALTQTWENIFDQLLQTYHTHIVVPEDQLQKHA